METYRLLCSNDRSYLVDVSKVEMKRIFELSTDYIVVLL